jgi:hypothetical protein
MAQAVVAFWPPKRAWPAKNGVSCLSASLDRSRIGLFLATAGLVAIGGGCARVPSGDDGPGPAQMGQPAAPPSAVPAAPRPATEKHNDEGGEGGEGGEG